MRLAISFYAFACTLLVTGYAFARPAEAPALPTQDPSAGMTLEDEKLAEAQEPAGTEVGVMGILSSNVNFDGAALFDMLLLQGQLRWTHPSWRVVLHPRIKVTPLATEDDKVAVFFQEAYASYRNESLAELKVGKVYEQFGRVWDFGVYGPLAAKLDLKLHPDLGFSLEGAPKLQSNMTLAYALQYFLVDGQTLRLVNGYHIESNARQRNIVVARLAPSWDIDDIGTVGVGVSGKRHTSFGSDRLGHQVLTVGADVNFERGPLQAFFEAGWQQGTSAGLWSPDTNYNPDGNLDSFTYLWGGASYDMFDFNVRFNWSASFYRDQPGTVEMLYQPGVGYFIGPNRDLQVAVEGAFWSSTNPMARAESAPGWLERAVYLVAVGTI